MRTQLPCVTFVTLLAAACGDVSKPVGPHLIPGGGVADGKISICPHPLLDAAVAGAKKRITGDSWAWDRKDPTTDVTPLMAATLAFRVASQVVDPAANVW